jgi:hypothetical protein
MGCDPHAPERDRTVVALRSWQQHGGLENARQLAAGAARPDDVEHAAARLYATFGRHQHAAPGWLELAEPERKTWRRAASRLLAELDAGARGAAIAETSLDGLIAAGIVVDLGRTADRLRDAIRRLVRPTAEATRRPKPPRPLTPWQLAARNGDRDPFDGIA